MKTSTLSLGIRLGLKSIKPLVLDRNHREPGELEVPGGVFVV